MELAPSAVAYLVLLLLVAALRIVELRVSRRHQQQMAAHGARKINDPKFRWMVLVHALVLLGSGCEVVFLKRPLIPMLASVTFLLFLAANVMRWWVIRTMGQHWNVQVVDSTQLGVVTSGPFRYVRHPNYAAVFVEMLALPMIHTAWITATLGAFAHIIVLMQRLSAEERVLLANAEYRATMGAKPRFLPGVF